MKVYVWRHNKTYHSHSMINEPCVQNHFYLDALAINRSCRKSGRSLVKAGGTECRLADRRPACAYSQGI